MYLLMANNILPARVGEFARALAFSKMEPVSLSAAFGSLVVERVLDGVVLLLFLLAFAGLSPGLLLKRRGLKGGCQPPPGSDEKCQCKSNGTSPSPDCKD